jgi:hypothetical protein
MPSNQMRKADVERLDQSEQALVLMVVSCRTDLPYHLTSKHTFITKSAAFQIYLLDHPELWSLGTPSSLAAGSSDCPVGDWLCTSAALKQTRAKHLT